MANNELDATLVNLAKAARQSDLVFVAQEYPTVVLLDGIAAEIELLVAAEQGAGTLASLTSAMGALVATIRLKASTIADATYHTGP